MITKRVTFIISGYPNDIKKVVEEELAANPQITNITCQELPKLTKILNRIRNRNQQ